MNLFANPADTIDLVSKAKAGNEKAFAALMNQWHKRIYNYAYRYSNQRAFAQEVVQQTFIQVYRKFDQLEDVLRFKPWLYKIASNCCHSEQRSRTNRNALVSTINEMPEVLESTTPSELYEKKERKNLVRMILQHIPEDQRVVIVMKEYEGLKFREIAEILGESENTVKSRLYYGLDAMKKQLLKRNLKEEIYHGS